jgi:hypothetical protein
VAVRLAPIEPPAALEALSSTRIARVVEGYRGQPPGDREAVAAAVSAVSHFIADFADDITDVEINPLAVLPAGKGCSALIP